MRLTPDTVGRRDLEVSSIEVNVDKFGPLFDGKAEELLKRAKTAIEFHIAERARDMARAYQLGAFRVQTTGAEPASLHVEQASYGHIVTDNHAIVYGPWLEGTGSRNETTRFKGYHAMRETTSAVDALAEGMANEIIGPFVDAMN